MHRVDHMFILELLIAGQDGRASCNGGAYFHPFISRTRAGEHGRPS
jgi:hypothetical protein